MPQSTAAQMRRRVTRLGAGLVASSLLAVATEAAQATPLVCTTSLEAPLTAGQEPIGSLSSPPAPVEVSRCAPIESTQAMVNRRSYTWRPPFAPGVSMLNQVTDILGITMGGLNGNRLMGLGFPDQALIWDGTAIQNTAYSLLELQSSPMPLRTPDLVSVFNTSLGTSGRLAQPHSSEEGGMPRYYLNPPLPGAN